MMLGDRHLASRAGMSPKLPLLEENREPIWEIQVLWNELMR